MIAFSNDRSHWELQIQRFSERFSLPETATSSSGTVQKPATELVKLHCGRFGERGPAFLMTPETAAQWSALRGAAAEAGFSLFVSSAYRTLEDQAALIQGALNTGMPLAAALNWYQRPGYSEHHTGRALDISPSDVEGFPTAENFERAPSFHWLCNHAGKFGFAMSYPRNNTSGLTYEPWHWMLQQAAAPELSSLEFRFHQTED